MGGKHSAGKGDRYRPVDYTTWSKNWEAIFGKSKKKNTKRKRNRKTHTPPRDAGLE